MDELPAALAVHPTVASVWLNVNDLVQGVSAADYGAQLRQLGQVPQQWPAHLRVVEAAQGPPELVARILG